MVERTQLFQIINYILTFAMGIILLHTPNKNIVAACPDSNMWYLVLLHCLTLEEGGVLMPFDIHAILDECNRKKLGNSPIYVYLAAPFYVLGMLLVICVVGLIINCCLVCSDWLFWTPQINVRPQRATETTALHV
jgi:hypothetical protein